MLKHFGLEPRDPKKPHNAYTDCEKTAELYMKLMQPKIKAEKAISVPK